MLKAQTYFQTYLRRHWPNMRVALLGLTTGAALFLGVRAVSPHPGESCSQLGQIAEEWELGAPTRHLLCVATLDGDLRYGRPITPEKPARERY
ncbi:MAG TPA: hypothetical protein VMB84_14905 [Stellaceae bacterium]|nr:hypothetical protein [Stellaceae bacterium]